MGRTHQFLKFYKCIAALGREALTGAWSVTRNLAQRLLAYETDAGKTSEPMAPPAFRVYEKLRQPLCALAGVAGFRSLITRALTLAQAEAPGLGAVQVTPDGFLQGFGEVQPRGEKQQSDDGGAILIAQLLGLLQTFIGEPLVLRLLQDVWPDAAFNDGNSEDGRKHEHTK